MNLHNFRTFLAFFACLFFATFFTLYNFSQQKEPKYSFIVKIPKEFNPNLTDDELAQFVADGYEFPNSLLELLEKKRMFLHSSPMLLVVSIQNDGKIKLNTQNDGDLSSTQSLTNHLTSIFDEREKNLVFEEGTNNILKKVIIKLSRSIKYGEVVKVIDAIKSSGAEPIVLQIDDLPN
jgi:biopolymer transport protein ExbD